MEVNQAAAVGMENIDQQGIISFDGMDDYLGNF